MTTVHEEVDGAVGQARASWDDNHRPDPGAPTDGADEGLPIERGLVLMTTVLFSLVTAVVLLAWSGTLGAR